jgi:hypothetical protein
MSVRNRTTPNALWPLDPGLWCRHEASARQPLMVVGADDPSEPSKAAEHRVELELTLCRDASALSRDVLGQDTVRECPRSRVRSLPSAAR